MDQAAGVVALFTPDEWSVLRPAHDPERGKGEESLRWQSRPNVIFEAGLAMGAAYERTLLVKLGRDVKLFSDVGGIHLINLDNTAETRNFFRQQLQGAGCQPDMLTSDHLNAAHAGDFESCVQFTDVKEPLDPFASAGPRRKKG